jgi:hypothetical protein
MTGAHTHAAIGDLEAELVSVARRVHALEAAGEVLLARVATLEANAPQPSPTYGTSGPLTPFAGNLIITTDGQVFENFDIEGTVSVRVPTATLRNCRVRGALGGTALVDCGRAIVANVLLDHVTLCPATPNTGWNGVTGHNVTVRGADISGTVDGIGAWNTTNSGGPLGVVVEDTWIHDLHVWTPDPNHADNRTHNDGIQIHTGGGIIIRRNRIDARPGPSSAPGLPAMSAIMVNGGAGKTLAPIVIEDNYLGGGTAVINAGDPSAAAYTATIRRNIIAADTGAKAIIAAKKYTFPGLPTVTGPDLNNGNVDPTGAPVVVSRY